MYTKMMTWKKTVKNQMNWKKTRSESYWKTLLCCPTEGDADDVGMMLWVSRPDEEEGTQERAKKETGVICFCKELEALSLPQQKHSAVVWVFHLSFPSLFPPSSLCWCAPKEH